MPVWESHVSEELSAIEMTGLGMNHSEMKVNPQLSDFLVHDLNKSTALPFEAETFDVVICTALIEYLSNPLAVFSEV